MPDEEGAPVTTTETEGATDPADGTGNDVGDPMFPVGLDDLVGLLTGLGLLLGVTKPDGAASVEDIVGRKVPTLTLGESTGRLVGTDSPILGEREARPAGESKANVGSEVLDPVGVGDFVPTLCEGARVPIF